MRRTLLCGLLGLAGVGCGGGSGTPTSGPPGQLPGTPAPPASPPAKKWTADELAAAKPDFKMSAVEWKKAAGEANWQAKYGGKVIEVEGEVWLLSNATGEGVTVTFHDSEKKSFSTMAFTPDRLLWEKLGTGSKAVLRGTPNAFGNSFSSELRPAVLVSADPNPAATVAAAELAKETTADAEAAEKKYKKYAFVTGEVVSFRPSKRNDGSGELVLKGTADVEVLVDCDKADAKAAQALKAGTKVRAYGRLLFLDAAEGRKASVSVGGSMFKAE